MAHAATSVASSGNHTMNRPRMPDFNFARIAVRCRHAQNWRAGRRPAVPPSMPACALEPTSDTGIDGENPVDLDELELILIDPVPSSVWYPDMVAVADGVSDRAAGGREPGLTAALAGIGR